MALGEFPLTQKTSLEISVLGNNGKNDWQDIFLYVIGSDESILGLYNLKNNTY